MTTTSNPPQDIHRRVGRAPMAFGVALLVLFSVLATACSQSINVETLEQELSSQIAVQLGVGVSAVQVVCPAVVEVTEGSQVECSAVVDGQSLAVTVTQTDGKGAMQWSLNPSDNAQEPSGATTTEASSANNGSVEGS